MSLERKVDDLYAWQLLAPLMVGHPYLAFTGSAVRPILLAHVLNDIVVNRRRTLIELGAGMSTMMIARLIVKNRLEARLLSIEHDAGWAEIVRDMLAAEGLEAHVELIVAPLAPCEHAVDGNTWYDRAALDAAVRGRRFDLALVDGPPAFEPGKQLARYPAAQFLREHMAGAASIYLDDADRAGEREILARWATDTTWTFQVLYGTFGLATIGATNFARPFVYHAASGD